MRVASRPRREAIGAASGWLLLVAAGCLGTAPAPVPSEPSASGQRPPNLLVIVTDDQRFDAMGCAGNPLVHTPQLDTLARDGVRFRNAFVTTAICAASRASIFTGLHESTHRYTFGTPPLRDEFVALSYPARLRDAGYRTGFVGKFGVTTGKGAPQRLFDSFVPLNTPYLQSQADGSVRHLSELTADRAVEFLAACRPDQPFCLSLSFHAPHAEDGDPRQFIPSVGSEGLYAETVFPVPKTMTPEFFAGLPRFLQESESRVRFHWRFDEPERYQSMVRGYHRMIADVDTVLGRLRAELTARGMAEDTVIVFCSDNGAFLGERGFADKWYLYEPSVRVPLIVFDPRLPELRRGTTCDLMALNVDLAPTLFELAGLPPAAEHQGRSLVPLLAGKAPLDWRTEFFYEHRFERPNIPQSEGLRTERFAYLRWLRSEPPREELYDHQTDFDEVVDLAGDPRCAELLRELRERTDAWRDRYAAAQVPAR